MFARRLRELGVALVVVEATGDLEMAVAGTLCAAGLPLAVVNPRQVRDFARAVGRLSKTDALDAAVIAHFADAIRSRSGAGAGPMCRLSPRRPRP